MSAEPPRSEVKTIQRPSRENEALKSRSRFGRNGRAWLPSGSAMKMSELSGAKLANAIVYSPGGSAAPGRASTAANQKLTHLFIAKVEILERECGLIAQAGLC